VSLVDPAAAVAVIDRLGGPASAASHFVKALPPSALNEEYLGKTIEDALLEAEAIWCTLIAKIAGPNVDPGAIKSMVFRVSGFRATGLAHSAPSEFLKSLPQAGLAKGFASAVACGRRLGMNVSRWPELIGLRERLREGQSAADEAAGLWAFLTNSQKELDDRVPRVDIENAQFSLWRLALRAPRGLTDPAGFHALSIGTSLTKAMISRYVLCKVINVDVWQLFGVAEIGGARCLLCMSALSSAQSPAREVPPSCVDNEGKHVSACKGMFPLFSNKRRHDAFAKAAAFISRQAGLDAHYHDGPLLDRGAGNSAQRYRPADWYCRDEDLKEARSGFCHDVTMRIFYFFYYEKPSDR
jgi:hypothetical protein